jgi:hypothetical protein
MQLGDWLNAATLLIIGVLLGIAIDAMAQLATTPYWPLVILIPLMFGGVLLLDGLLNRLANRIFPSAIRTVGKSESKPRKPLALLLSLPAGLILGIVLARFGLANTVLDLFP